MTTELCVYVATDAPVKFYKLKITNRSGRPRQLSVTGYWELVLGDSRSKSLHARGDGNRSGERRDSRPQCLQPGVRRPGGVRQLQRSEPHVHRRPHRVSGPQRQAGQSRGHAARATLGPRRSGIRSLRRDSGAADARRRARADHHLHDRRRARRSGGARHLRSASAASTAPIGRSKASGITGAGRWAWSMWKRPTRRSISWRTAGSSIRRWPAACGPARDSINREARSGSATNCRTRWPWCMPSRSCSASICCAPLARQFREGDVQHWWHPPVGRGVRTHFSDDYLWLPLAICRYVGTTGDTGVLDERVPFLTSRPLARRRRIELRPAAGLGRRRHALRAWRPRDRSRLALWRAWPAADGLRRLERRHEPRRPARPGRKRVAGVLPVSRAHAVRRSGAAARRRGARRSTTRSKPAACAATSKSTAGTASGIAGPTSTTARRSARPRTKNARSMRSRKAGRFSPAPARRSERTWPWRASIVASSAETHG